MTFTPAARIRLRHGSSTDPELDSAKRRGFSGRNGLDSDDTPQSQAGPPSLMKGLILTTADGCVQLGVPAANGGTGSGR